MKKSDDMVMEIVDEILEMISERCGSCQHFTETDEKECKSCFGFSKHIKKVDLSQDLAKIVNTQGRPCCN